MPVTDPYIAMTSNTLASIMSARINAVKPCLAVSQRYQKMESRGRAAAAPVGAFERVVHQGALADTPSCLTLRVSGEPVVGEDCVGRTVLLAVLEQ